jgi:hypothetical protein
MGVNEGNCISCYLSNIIKGEPCCFFLTPCLLLVFDTAGLENAPSFDEANLFSYLDQGKHLASSLYRFLL